MNPYEAPENNYILVMPDGSVVGFEESDMAQAYTDIIKKKSLLIVIK